MDGIDLFQIMFALLCFSVACVGFCRICADHCCSSKTAVEESDAIPLPEDIVKITDMWISQENEVQTSNVCN